MQRLVQIADKMEQPCKRNGLLCWFVLVLNFTPILRRRGKDVYWLGVFGLYAWWLSIGFEGPVDVVPDRTMLVLVVAADVISPPCRLHEQHEAMIGSSNILQP